MNAIHRIHHVALVVEDLDGAIAFWRDVIGLPLVAVQDVPGENVRVAFLPAGETQIELVLPTTADSGVARHLTKRGPGMHHLCLEVTDLDATLDRLRQSGVRLIYPEPAIGADGRRMAFLHPASTQGVLIELYEVASGPSS